jgi:hypothetical protein
MVMEREQYVTQEQLELVLRRMREHNAVTREQMDLMREQMNAMRAQMDLMKQMMEAPGLWQMGPRQ